MSKVYASTLRSELGEDICSPFFDKFGSLHIVSSNSGNVSALHDDAVLVVHNTNGQPSGAAFDEYGVLYVTDHAHGAVLAAQTGGANPAVRNDFRFDQQDVVVAVYEDKPLKGPSSITFDKNGNIFFTDSGIARFFVLIFHSKHLYFLCIGVRSFW
jgi:sugar lactone lactonase YvrE